MEYALVNKSAICKEEGTKGKVMVSCLRWWRVRWQSNSMCLVRSWKTKLWAIWIELWLSQNIEVGWEKKTRISASNQRNQTISLVVDAMAEAEGKSKYQILQKRKTKYHSIFFCRNWRKDEIPKLQRQNINIKLQKLKESWNTKFYKSGRQNITLKNIAETECKYQIAETEEKTKYQNNCRNRTKISNCRSWRKVEIPDFAETKNKISLPKNL